MVFVMCSLGKKIPINYYPTDFCVRVKGGKILNNGTGIKILKLICK